MNSGLAIVIGLSSAVLFLGGVTLTVLSGIGFLSGANVVPFLLASFLLMISTFFPSKILLFGNYSKLPAWKIGSITCCVLFALGLMYGQVEPFEHHLACNCEKLV